MKGLIVFYYLFIYPCFHLTSNSLVCWINAFYLHALNQLVKTMRIWSNLISKIFIQFLRGMLGLYANLNDAAEFFRGPDSPWEDNGHCFAFLKIWCKGLSILKIGPNVSVGKLCQGVNSKTIKSQWFAYFHLDTYRCGSEIKENGFFFLLGLP